MIALIVFMVMFIWIVEDIKESGAGVAIGGVILFYIGAGILAYTYAQDINSDYDDFMLKYWGYVAIAILLTPVIIAVVIAAVYYGMRDGGLVIALLLALYIIANVAAALAVKYTLLNR